MAFLPVLSLSFSNFESFEVKLHRTHTDALPQAAKGRSGWTGCSKVGGQWPGQATQQ